MKRLLLAALLSVTAFGAHARAATTTLSIIINSPASTTVTCTQTQTWTAPLAAGTVICPITIAPSGWSGALAISGTGASSFALSGSNLVVGSTALQAATYSVTITATP